MRSEPIHPAPIATVDAVLMTLRSGVLCVGLVERERPPCAGRLALPGGYVHVPEDANLEASAARILREKAQVQCRFLEQLATFSGVDRDPRGWSLTVAYYALVPEADLSAAEGTLSLHPVAGLPELAFDHAAIVAAAVDRLRGRSSYSALPAFLLPRSSRWPSCMVSISRFWRPAWTRPHSGARCSTRGSWRLRTLGGSGRTVPRRCTGCGPAGRSRSSTGSDHDATGQSKIIRGWPSVALSLWEGWGG